MFKLYYFPGACSLAPHLLLEEMGLPFQLVKMDPENGGMESAEFLKLNPMGAVPVLVLENGEALTEVAVILQYLADKKPELGLLPAGTSLSRYRVLEKVNFIATEIHKGFGPLFSPESFATDAAAQAQVENQGEKLLRQRLAVVESWFADGRFYCTGGQVTIADFYLQVVLLWAKPLKLDLTQYPKLTAFSERMRERENTKRAYATEFSRTKG